MICSDVLWFLTSGVSKDFITQSARTGTTFFVLKVCYSYVSFYFERTLTLALQDKHRSVSSSLTDPEVLWAHGAGVHGCNPPPGLRGAAVHHLEDEASCRHEPGGGQRPAASQSQSARLYPAHLTEVRFENVEIHSWSWKQQFDKT